MSRVMMVKVMVAEPALVLALEVKPVEVAEVPVVQPLAVGVVERVLMVVVVQVVDVVDVCDVAGDGGGGLDCRGLDVRSGG